MYLSVPCVYMFMKCTTHMHDICWVWTYANCIQYCIVFNLCLCAVAQVSFTMAFFEVVAPFCFVCKSSLFHCIQSYVYTYLYIVCKFLHRCRLRVYCWNGGRIWGRGPIFFCIYNPTLSVYPILSVHICIIVCLCTGVVCDWIAEKGRFGGSPLGNAFSVSRCVRERE